MYIVGVVKNLRTQIVGLFVHMVLWQVYTKIDTFGPVCYISVFVFVRLLFLCM